jgi:hypothetical protein
MIKTLAIAALLACAGCASLDRMDHTSLAPMKSEGGFAYYRYVAVADAVYPLSSAEAEKTRIEWLEKWLADNGHPGAQYEIVLRTPMLRYKALMSGVYDIYYDVRVKGR